VAVVRVVEVEQRARVGPESAAPAPPAEPLAPVEPEEFVDAEECFPLDELPAAVDFPEDEEDEEPLEPDTDVCVAVADTVADPADAPSSWTPSPSWHAVSVSAAAASAAAVSRRVRPVRRVRADM
jgi:hypothetical protein